MSLEVQHPVQAVAIGLAMAVIVQARSEGHDHDPYRADLAETLRDIDGQIGSAEDEIWRLQAWRAEVVALLEQARAEQPDAEGERDGGV